MPVRNLFGVLRTCRLKRIFSQPVRTTSRAGMSDAVGRAHEWQGRQRLTFAGERFPEKDMASDHDV